MGENVLLNEMTIAVVEADNNVYDTVILTEGTHVSDTGRCML